MMTSEDSSTKIVPFKKPWISGWVKNAWGSICNNFDGFEYHLIYKGGDEDDTEEEC